VDRLGTLSDAVAFAADQAKLKTYDVRVVPKPKNFLERLTERASGGKGGAGPRCERRRPECPVQAGSALSAEPGSAAHRGHRLGSEPAGDSAKRGRGADDAGDSSAAMSDFFQANARLGEPPRMLL
jgi:ClpP class serine protease